MNRWNFGRNVLIESRNQFTPKNEEEVLEILNAHPGRRIRCVGRLHSWSRVLDSPDILLDLRNFNQLDPSDTPVPSVHVGAGCQIKQLIHELEAITPWTLPSLGFITEQTVAGAISTGTHGSGRHSLSHYVIGLRVARYDTRTGKAVVVDITDAEELRAARCSLGCIGVILRVTMQCRPQYMVEESFHEYPKLDEVLAAEQAYPLQQFYLVPWRWSFMAQHRRESPSQASRSNWIYQKYRFVILDLAMHWLILFSVRILRMPSAVRAVFRWIAPAFVIQNWRVVGPSSQQLIMEHEMFRHIELELFVQRHQLPPAMAYLRKALEAAGDSKTERSDDAPSPPSATLPFQDGDGKSIRYCHHYPICIRKVLPDDTLISMSSNAQGNAGEASHPSYNGSTMCDDAWYAITLTNYDRGERRRRFEAFASCLAKAMMQQFGARPHWGKLCPLSAEELQGAYPAFDRFRQVCDGVDPTGAFRNPWTAQLLQTKP